MFSLDSLDSIKTDVLSLITLEDIVIRFQIVKESHRYNLLFIAIFKSINSEFTKITP